jgi:hypothetical protein
MTEVEAKEVLAALASAKGFVLSEEDLDELAPWFADFQLRLEKLWAADLGEVWQSEPELVASPKPNVGPDT